MIPTPNIIDFVMNADDVSFIMNSTPINFDTPAGKHDYIKWCRYNDTIRYYPKSTADNCTANPQGTKHNYVDDTHMKICADCGYQTVYKDINGNMITGNHYRSVKSGDPMGNAHMFGKTDWTKLFMADGDY